MADKTREQIRVIIIGVGIHSRQFAEMLSMPERGVTFTRGYIANLKAMTQSPDLRKLRLVYLYNQHEVCREFARRVLEAEGFWVFEQDNPEDAWQAMLDEGRHQENARR